MDEDRLNQYEVPGSFPTKAVTVRRALEIHRHWIEGSLGVSLSDAVILEVDMDITQIGTERILGGDGQDSIPTRTLRRLRTLVADIEVPSDVPPVLEMVDHSANDDLIHFLGGATRRKNLHMEWGDCPIALKFYLHGTVLVAINVPFFDGPASNYASIARLVIARRDCAREAIRLIGWIVRKDRQPRIQIQDGPARQISPCRWDDLVLAQTVVSLVRDDFESFFERKSWFRKNKLPFRRGYLFHGPPGNGKTSVIRAMMSSKGLTAHTLRFFDLHKDDSDLDRLFEEAMKDRPSMILLEDIDRAFPKSGESKSNISLQQLLNCLDGVGTGNGVVVVASANDARLLDPAILRRPGRFDRVVHFPNPNEELRLKYFIKFNPKIDADKLQQAVVESDGFSFAYLKEATVVAGQLAFQSNRDINAHDLLHGVRTLRNANVLASEGPRSAGFGSTRTVGMDTIKF